MKKEYYKYNIEIKIENMSIENLTLLKSVLDVIPHVLYKEFNSISLTSAQKTSI